MNSHPHAFLQQFVKGPVSLDQRRMISDADDMHRVFDGLGGARWG
ncbi:MAG: hypothetical protein R3F13_18740 [Prosthecobacter sp.]